MHFAAKLLFIWNPDPVTGSRVNRLCEERILTFQARSAADAVRKAKSLGRSGSVRYESGHRLQFAGVLQCMELESHDQGEVWWEFRRRANPETWAKKALPPDAELYVHTDGAKRSAGVQPKRPRAELRVTHPPKARR